ncbi:MAG TPA: MBL fold metallo-hydrolase [Candidatus Dormibacteraeota bacterium]|nr:MBL fold metallo-hydrolase [Candidatus Dormibacteraeota bacterium]
MPLERLFIYNIALMANLTFLGAAGSVTGSKFLIEAEGKRLLVDCGLFQGLKELRQRNWNPLQIDPASIDWAILTHAHLDHTGWLPRFVKQGFRNTIFANNSTIVMSEILLRDSGRLQEEDAEHAAQHSYSKHSQPLPLYTEADVAPVTKLFQEIPRIGAFTISPQFTFRAYDAGHILGSTSLELTITENGKTIVVVFSGDIGRYGQPILNDPVTPPHADYLLCESTYGDRVHPKESPVDALAEIVNRAVRRGGVIVIPAFAVGRTQILMYVLHLLEIQKRIPHLPVFIDSPMAIAMTDLYLKHREDHSALFRSEERVGDPLNMRQVHLARAPAESKAINHVKTPCIIISASGMAAGGRVLHHLAQRLPDPRNIVLLPGFQAEGTRGRALLEGANRVRIHGADIPVRAEIVQMQQFSAHAGQDEILRWLRGFQAPPRGTFLIHGEQVASVALKALIETQLKWRVSVAQYLEIQELNAELSAGTN